MKPIRYLIFIVLLGSILAACDSTPLLDRYQETLAVTHQGIRMQVLSACLADDDLIVSFRIDHSHASTSEQYRLRMPWHVLDIEGNRFQSSYSEAYHAIGDDGMTLPGSLNLNVTFPDYTGSLDSMSIETLLEPLYLAESDNHYTLEAPLINMGIDALEPVVFEHMGLTVSGQATMIPDGLAVMIRIEGADPILSTLTYPVQPVILDDLHNQYVCNRTQRGPRQPGVREEILYFEMVDPAAAAFSILYPFQMKAELPEPIPFIFHKVNAES